MTLVDRFSDGCGLFEFDIATPLFQQLSSDFDLLEPVPLLEWNLSSVEERPGIYGLHHNGLVVYIGKADDLQKGDWRNTDDSYRAEPAYHQMR